MHLLPGPMSQLGDFEAGKVHSNTASNRRPTLTSRDLASVGYNWMPVVWMNSAKPYRT